MSAVTPESGHPLVQSASPPLRYRSWWRSGRPPSSTHLIVLSAACVLPPPKRPRQDRCRRERGRFLSRQQKRWPAAQCQIVRRTVQRRWFTPSLTTRKRQLFRRPLSHSVIGRRITAHIGLLEQLTNATCRSFPVQRRRRNPSRMTMELGPSRADTTRGGAAPEFELAESRKSWINGVNSSGQRLCVTLRI